MSASDVGEIKITKTMLDKGIIDANKTIVNFALGLGIDYAKMECAEKHTIDAFFDMSFFLKIMHKETQIKFYRINNPRGDKRISIKDLKHYYDIGDVITLKLGSYGVEKGKVLICIKHEQEVKS